MKSSEFNLNSYPFNYFQGDLTSQHCPKKCLEQRGEWKEISKSQMHLAALIESVKPYLCLSII